MTKGEDVAVAGVVDAVGDAVVGGVRPALTTMPPSLSGDPIVHVCTTCPVCATSLRLYCGQPTPVALLQAAHPSLNAEGQIRPK